MKMNYLVSLSLNACVTIIISSCGNDEKIPKDISFDEIKTLNMEYFSRISASTRQYPLGVIRLHFGDSCMYEQLLLKNNEEGNLEFKADTTWHNIDELCIYYDCNKYNLSYSRVKVIYDFIWKYNINVNSSCELDRIYFNGIGYTYVYYYNDTIPFDKEWKRMNDKWWLIEDKKGNGS